MVDTYDFSGISTLVDVGGGVGGYITHVLGQYPSMTGILFDRPPLEQHALAYLSEHGVGDRCQFVGGSFFDSVPEGADAYLLSHVLHDWPDDEAISILGCCRRLMSPSSRLLVEEVIAAAGSGANMTMMVNFGEAKNRTVEEFQHLMEDAGLRLVRVIPTGGDSTILEAAVA
jgi:hypothetical protein